MHPPCSCLIITLFKNALYICTVILDYGLVIICIKQRRRYEVISRRTIHCRRHIVQRRQTQQCLDIDIMRLGRHRIPEKHQRIDFTAGYQGSQLLVTAQRSRFEFHNIQFRKLVNAGGIAITGNLLFMLKESLLDHFAGRAGAYQTMFTQFHAVPIDPFGQIPFHVVVCHKGYGPHSFHSLQLFLLVTQI